MPHLLWWLALSTFLLSVASSLQLPALPDPGGVPWLPNTEEAINEIYTQFTRASEFLRLSDIDPHRVFATLTTTFPRILNIFAIFVNQPQIHRVPLEWTHAALQAYDLLTHQLEHFVQVVHRTESRPVTQLRPVKIVKIAGKRGRPRKVPVPALMHRAFSVQSSLSQKQFARLTKLHYNTVNNYLKLYHINVKHSTISDGDLRQLCVAFRREHPTSGVRQLDGALRAQNIKIPYERLRLAMSEIDQLRNTLRGRDHIVGKRYHVARPHALWHCDVHHKLIRWGIVIHGFIDGCTRLITGIRAHTDNLADTVLRLFEDALVGNPGPSRVRGDCGGENVKVSHKIIEMRGANRHSFIWGLSTHNTRIERLWVDIGRAIIRQWRAFFWRLERLHGLNPTKPTHLWLIHFLFLDMINADIDDFKSTHNAHKIQGLARNKTPAALSIIGELENGAYDDPIGFLLEEEVTAYYGTFGEVQRRRPGQTGAGHDPEEGNVAIGAAAAHAVTTDNASHFIAAVEVPSKTSPYNAQEDVHEFRRLVDGATRLAWLPSGLGIRPNEMEGGFYSAIEAIPSGKRGTKELHVDLPHEIWITRAQLWCRALYIMSLRQN